jgi:hypothetical protein
MHKEELPAIFRMEGIRILELFPLPLPPNTRALEKLSFIVSDLLPVMQKPLAVVDNTLSAGMKSAL